MTEGVIALMLDFDCPPGQIHHNVYGDYRVVCVNPTDLGSGFLESALKQLSEKGEGLADWLPPRGEPAPWAQPYLDFHAETREQNCFDSSPEEEPDGE